MSSCHCYQNSYQLPGLKHRSNPTPPFTRKHDTPNNTSRLTSTQKLPNAQRAALHLNTTATTTPSTNTTSTNTTTSTTTITTTNNHNDPHQVQLHHSITQTQWTTNSRTQHVHRNNQYDLPHKDQNTTTTHQISKDKNCLRVDHEKHIC